MDSSCIRHPEAPAAFACKACGRPICDPCASYLPDGPFCSAKCSDAAAGGVAMPPLQAGSGARRREVPAAAPAPPAPAPAVQAPEAGNSNLGLQIAVGVLSLALAGLALMVVMRPAPPPAPVAHMTAVEPAKPPPADPPRPAPIVNAPKPPPPQPPKPLPVEVPKPPAEPPKPAPAEPPKPVLVEVPKPPVDLPKPAPVEPPKPVLEPVKPVPVDPPKPVPPPPPVEPPKVVPAVQEPPRPREVGRPSPIEVPRPIAPAVPEPPPPAAEPAKPARPNPKISDPWGMEKVGAWYRVKRTASGLETFLDTGLKAADAENRLLVTQTWVKDRGAEQVKKLPPPALPAGGETLGIDGARYECDVYETASAEGAVRRWVVREGPHAGVQLRRESGGVSRSATRLQIGRVTVRDRAWPCTVVEEEGGERFWFSAACPLGVVRSEQGGAIEELTDFGDDWSQRLFPAEKAREDAVKQLAEARKIVRDATPLYIQVQDAASAPPEGEAERKLLHEKGLLVQARLEEVRRTYVRSRPWAADPTAVDRWVGQIDELLVDLKKSIPRFAEKSK